ncbi:MAG TPA: di-heme oxidoredictase family protein [Anaeromyxobacteraceae bacterium]|nr:di-heme oxidoredictase family protein [Anaeromyxobacteraceae bacterium]
MTRSAGLLLALCASAGCLPPVPGNMPPLPAPLQEAPAAFDGLPNGLVDQATHQADREAFDEAEEVDEGLGPLYNAQSCRECHQNPASGGNSQVTELRAGHRDRDGRFAAPAVPIAGGAEVIEGRTLINDRAICPSAEFPDQEIQERVPEVDTIRTERISLGLMGDGLVELVPDELLKQIAQWQCRETKGRVCGLAVQVPVLEAPGTYAVGRFGWKAQQASLLSFAADAYLNEMGITSRLMPDEVTERCDTVADPEDRPSGDGLADIDRFARFMRATKAPSQDAALAATPAAVKGSALFDRAGCATCHVRTLATAPAGTPFHGGKLLVPPALGGKAFHPFGDFLLHDVGTGDGIVVAILEHHGKAYRHMQPQFEPTANRIRTPPLWGLRTRSRLMHDGLSVTARDAIRRHRGEADDARRRFERLSDEEQEALLAFLRSL